MKQPPSSIDGAHLLLFADLSDSLATGKTRHTVDGVEAHDFAALAIVRYENEEGVYLFYCDDQWRAVTDTYHASVEEAIAQAEFEFEPVEFHAI